MNHTILQALATPEAENGATSATELTARSVDIARELGIALETASAVDWEQVLDSGGGPCLALGAERRLRRGAT